MVMVREPRRYKIQLENSMIEQVIHFKYLGTKIRSHRDMFEEVQMQKVSSTNSGLPERLHNEKQIYENRSKNKSVQSHDKTNIKICH